MHILGKYCINYLKLNYAINNGLLDLSVRKGGGIWYHCT